MKRERKTPSINESWVRDETLNGWKASAIKTLTHVKKMEKETEHEYKYVKVCERPLTYFRKKVKN